MDSVSGVMACKRSSVRSRPASSHESPQRLRLAGFVVDRATRQTEALFRLQPSCLGQGRGFLIGPAPRHSEVARNSVVVCQRTVKRPHVGAHNFVTECTAMHTYSGDARCQPPRRSEIRGRPSAGMCSARRPDTIMQPARRREGGCWGRGPGVGVDFDDGTPPRSDETGR